MRLELTGRKLEITPVIRRLVERKLAKLERILDHRALSAQVVLVPVKRDIRVDITLHARGEKFLHGVGEAGELEAALNRATEKLEQQAQKVKGKWQARKRSAGGRTTSEPAEREAESSASASRTPVRMPRVLRTMRQVVRTLSVADAARRLDGADEGVVVFRDEETDGLSVLYRSAGGELVLVVTAS
mgnify:CR=1 FL=1